MQEITLYGVAVVSVLAFAAAFFHEIEAKALRTKVRLLYAGQMSTRLASFQQSLSKKLNSRGISYPSVSLSCG